MDGRQHSKKGSIVHRVIVAGAVALAIVLSIAACGDDGVSPFGQIYTLTSIDGESLPVADSVVHKDEVLSFYRLKNGRLQLTRSKKINIVLGVDRGPSFESLSPEESRMIGNVHTQESENRITFAFPAPYVGSLTGSFRNDSIIIDRYNNLENLVFIRK